MRKEFVFIFGSCVRKLWYGQAIILRYLPNVLIIIVRTNARFVVLGGLNIPLNSALDENVTSRLHIGLLQFL